MRSISPWPRLGAVIGALNISTLRGRLGDEVSIRLCMIVMGVCVAAVASSRSAILIVGGAGVVRGGIPANVG